MTAADAVQAGIVGCSGLAAWLVNAPGRHSRGVAALVGLAGQPLWFWTAWQAGQWGVLVLSGWYALSWGRGLWHWCRG